MLGRRRGPAGSARSSPRNNSNAHKSWKETMSESEDSDIGDLATAVADARKREAAGTKAPKKDDDTSSESSDMRIMSDGEDMEITSEAPQRLAKGSGKKESRSSGSRREQKESKRKAATGSSARSKPKKRKRYAWMDSDESSITENSSSSSSSSEEGSSSSEDERGHNRQRRSASLSPTAERPAAVEKALDEGRKLAARINVCRNQDEFWEFIEDLDPRVPMYQGGPLPGASMAAAVHRLTGFVYQYYHTPQEMISLVKSRSMKKLTDIVETGIKRFSHISNQISNMDLTTIVISVAKLGVHCDKLSNTSNTGAMSSQKQGLSANASGTPANPKSHTEVPVIFGAEVVLALASEARRRGPDAFMQAGLSQLCELCWGIAKALQCCCSCQHERQNALEFIQHGRKDLDSFYCSIAEHIYESDMDSLTIPDICNICMGFSLARSMGLVSTEKSTLSRPGTMEKDEAQDPPAYVLMAKGILPQLRDRLSYRSHAVNALGAAPPLPGETPPPAWQRTGQYRLNPQQTCDITCNLAQMDIYDEQVYNLIGQMAIMPRLREFGSHQIRRLRDAFDLVRHDGDYELLRAMRQRTGGSQEGHFSGNGLSGNLLGLEEIQEKNGSGQSHGGRRTGAVIHSETVRYINQREFMRRVQPQPNS